MDKNNISKTLQATRKRLALVSLADFRKMYLSTKEDYENSPAHVEFMSFLDDLLRNPGQKLAWAGPRGFGKTDIMTAFIIYALCLNKYRYILILSHTSKQAQDMLKNVKTLMMNSPYLVQDFPDVIKGVQVVTPKATFKVNDKIKISSFGLKQSFRGTKFGRLRPDLVIVDDLDSDNYLHNRDVKESMREIFNGKVLKIGHEKTNIIFNGNIFSRNTLIWDIFNDPAYAMFRRVNYKAIKNLPHRMDLWDKHLMILRDQENYKGRSGKEASDEFYKDQKELMNRGFESLWPKRWEASELIPQFLSDPDRFKREMQNEPASGESCFNPDNFNYWNKNGRSREELLASFGNDRKVCVAIDPSMGKINGDFSAIAVVAKHRDTYYVFQVLLLREKTDVLFDYIFAIVGQGVPTVVIETDGGQDYLASQLESESIKRKTLINLVRVKQKDTKEMRIRGLTALINTGMIQFNCDDRLFLEQMREFPLGRHDDGPDALEMAVRTLMGMKDGFTEGINIVSNIMNKLKDDPSKISPALHETLMRYHGSAVRGTFAGGGFSPFKGVSQ